MAYPPVNPFRTALTQGPFVPRADGTFAPVAGADLTSPTDDVGPQDIDPATADILTRPDPFTRPTRLTYPVGTMSPADAASILSRHLSPGSDALELSDLRGGRIGELNERIAQDLRTPNDPESVRDLGAARFRVAGLQRDADLDPDTGLEAMKQISDDEKAIHQAAAAQRPELTDAARAVAGRNAFAKFFDTLSGYQAQNTPEGKAALDAAARRQAMIEGAKTGAKLKLTAQGKQSVTAFEQAKTLGNDLIAILEDPNSSLHKQTDAEAARAKGVTGQLMDSATAATKRWLYAHGVVGPKDYDTATQLADWMKVAATTGLLKGVRNMQWIEQIQDHLAQGRLPPAANLERLRNFMAEVDKLENDVFEGEGVPRPDRLDEAASENVPRPHAAGGPRTFGPPVGQATPAPAAAGPSSDYLNYLRNR